MSGDIQAPLAYPAPPHRQCANLCPHYAHVGWLQTDFVGVPPVRLEAHSNYIGEVVIKAAPTSPPALPMGVCTLANAPRGLVPAAWGCQFHPNA